MNGCSRVIEIRVFFHKRASYRQRQNKGKGLFDNNDVWVSDVDGMKNIVSNYFTNLFTSSNPTNMERVTDLLPRRVMAEHNEFLMKPLTKLEVYEALMDMDPSKAPFYGIL